VGVGAYLVKPPNARELERAITITRARFADLQALRRLNRELQLANQDLDAFSRMVAHDLKHFLGPVLLIAESLTEDDGFIDVKEAVHFLPRIAQAARDMDNVIEGLLLLAHMRRKNLVLVPLDMGALVQGSLRRLSHLINQRSATIRQPESWPTVLSFAQGVVEIWVNYLSNAVKYGGESPLIELGWQELTASEAVTAVGDESVIGTPNCVCQPAYRMSGEDLLIPPHRQPMGCFWVKDHGVGIAEVNIPALFEDAAREGALAPKREGLEGHGLGLPIVKHIVEKLGGSVYVRSEVGEGSTFAFTLPLSDEKPEA
jgi:signal transduction histidine kinase